MQLKFYGADWCPDCHRSKRLLNQHGVSFTFLDTDQDPAAAKFARSLNEGRLVIPTIVVPDATTLFEPTDNELRRKLEPQD